MVGQSELQEVHAGPEEDFFLEEVVVQVVGLSQFGLLERARLSHDVVFRSALLVSSQVGLGVFLDHQVDELRGYERRLRVKAGILFLSTC